MHGEIFEFSKNLIADDSPDHELGHSLWRKTKKLAKRFYNPLTLDCRFLLGQ